MNGDRHITQAEINSCKVVLAGYSWGATSAIHVAQMLNKVGSHTFGVKHHPSDPTITYTVDAPIPVASFVVVDPVKIARPDPGPMPNNVSKFVNWYQNKKGNTDFVDQNCCVNYSEGSGFSRYIGGYNPSSNAATNEIVNVTTQKRWNYIRVSVNGQVYRLFGKNVAHVYMPLFVKECLQNALQP